MNVQKIRRFNRFYTHILGIFDQNVFESKYSLLEMRILGEISRHKGITGQRLCKYLNIDKGYLSRILSKFYKEKIIMKVKNEEDNRIYNLFLTSKGEQLNEFIEKESDEKILNLLRNMTNEEIKDLENSMETIKLILKKEIDNDMEEL